MKKESGTMKRKLEVPITSRLPVGRWWNRKKSPFAAYAANHNLNSDDLETFRRLTVVCKKS